MRYLLFLLLLIIGCDEADITQTLSHITSKNAYDGMVLIPAGEVTIGAPPGVVHPAVIANGLILPEQTIFVDAFYIETHEVTVAEFQAFVDATGYKGGSWNYYKEHTPQHPIFASYDAATAYAEWAGKRLPTDAEWEKAARGGLVGTYPWGDEAPTKAHARFDDRSAKRPYTVPVGSYPPNGYGLYDMAGNVGEWTTDPDGEAFTHGGNWYLSEWFMRVYIRERPAPSGHYNTMGFRCVKAVNLQDRAE